MPAAALAAKRVRERLPERAPGRRDLRLGLSGRDLELQVERRVFREQHEQVVEHRQSGDDARFAGPADVHTGVKPAGLVRLPRSRHRA
jgi:hypothetical protein